MTKGASEQFAEGVISANGGKGCWKKQRDGVIDSCPQGGDSNKRVQIHLPPTSTGPGSNSLKRCSPEDSCEVHKKARGD